MDELSDEDFIKMEQFVIHLYIQNTKCENINELRVMMATKSSLDKLPPTRNALKQHCLRTLYQTIIWKNALMPKPNIPPYLHYGWQNISGDIKPIFMTQNSVPSLKAEVPFCSCKTGTFRLIIFITNYDDFVQFLDCATTRCTCKINKLSCLSSCHCMATISCRNDFTEHAYFEEHVEEEEAADF